MLLPIDMNPETSVYYYGAIIIKVLKNHSENNYPVDIVELYRMVKNQVKISLISYSLALDWLYLIESVIVDERGGVELCILED